MSCPAALHNDDATKIQDSRFLFDSCGQTSCKNFLFSSTLRCHGTDSNCQTRNSGVGNRKSCPSIQCKACSGSPHPRSTSAEMFKAQSRARPQNPDSRLKTKAHYLTPSDLPFPRKSKIPFENEATTQRPRLGTRRMENKMIGSRCPRPNLTVLRVDPRTHACSHCRYRMKPR
jgi:hypothetical protein